MTRPGAIDGVYGLVYFRCCRSCIYIFVLVNNVVKLTTCSFAWIQNEGYNVDGGERRARAWSSDLAWTGTRLKFDYVQFISLNSNFCSFYFIYCPNNGKAGVHATFAIAHA